MLANVIPMGAFIELSVSRGRSGKNRASFTDDDSGLLEINTIPDL